MNSRQRSSSRCMRPRALSHFSFWRLLCVCTRKKFPVTGTHVYISSVMLLFLRETGIHHCAAATTTNSNRSEQQFSYEQCVEPKLWNPNNHYTTGRKGVIYRCHRELTRHHNGCSNHHSSNCDNNRRVTFRCRCRTSPHTILVLCLHHRSCEETVQIFCIIKIT